MSELQDERARRLAKVEALRAQGRDPYPVRFDRTHTTAELHEAYGGIDAGAEVDDTVRVAGRLLLIRRQGKLTFATLRDGTGSVQLFVSRAVIGDERHAAFDDLDLGDWVGAEGTVMKTRKGELSVKVTRFELLAKALRPLPDKWHGLADVDTRFRQRYVDLIVNDDARRVFEIRFAAIDAHPLVPQGPRLRRGGDAGAARGQAGGAAAQARSSRTTTRSTSISRSASRSSCPSSACSSAGSRRSSRSGGCSATRGCRRRHNPEFTMLEAYEAFADYTDMMDLTEEIVAHVAQVSIGTHHRSRSTARPIDLAPPWRAPDDARADPGARRRRRPPVDAGREARAHLRRPRRAP